MGLSDWFTKKRGINFPNAKWLEVDDFGKFYHLFVNSMNRNSFCFDDFNPYFLAKTFSEIYNPIDLISDKVASVDYKVVDNNGVEIENLPDNLSKLLIKPNGFTSFRNFIYNVQFSELSTGSSYVYPVVSKTLKKDVENISNIFVIEPNLISMVLKNNIENPIYSKSFNEFIKYFQTNFLGLKQIPSDDIILNITTSFNNELGGIYTPLDACKRNIENLAVCYSARYNVFANNGSGGIISRKSAQDGDLQQFQEDGEMRQKILDEMNKRDGIVGNKNFIGISSIPIEFIKTLGTISELMPFEETQNDALAIAGVYSVSPYLLNSQANSTFSNVKSAELSLWQNKIISLSKSMAKKLDEYFFLKNTPYKFKADFSNVQILQETRGIEIDTDLKEVELYKELMDLGIKNDKIISKWIN